jgi:hypothetical protein
MTGIPQDQLAALRHIDGKLAKVLDQIRELTAAVGALTAVATVAGTAALAAADAAQVCAAAQKETNSLLQKLIDLSTQEPAADLGLSDGTVVDKP